MLTACLLQVFSSKKQRDEKAVIPVYKESIRRLHGVGNKTFEDLCAVYCEGSLTAVHKMTGLRYSLQRLQKYMHVWTIWHALVYSNVQ